MKEVQNTLAALPGMQDVAMTNDPELAGNAEMSNITVEGYNPSENENLIVERPSVSPNYFSTMGMPLVAGRAFSDSENRKDGPKVAVVNETFARKWLGDAHRAVGAHIGRGSGAGTKTDTEIVGVVRDARHRGVRDEVVPTTFIPIEQSDVTGFAMYARTSDPSTMMSSIRSAVAHIDSKLVLDTFRTMDAQIDDNLATESLIALLASCFGGLALLLSAVGLYGVLAYSATQRTREIGIRMALGADRHTVVRMMLGEVSKLVVISVAVAVPTALIAGRALRSQLYGVSHTDPFTLIAVVAVITFVALAASMMPAMRAANVDPMKALRYE
jgi:predicted permease